MGSEHVWERAVVVRYTKTQCTLSALVLFFLKVHGLLCFFEKCMTIKEIVKTMIQSPNAKEK